MAKAFQLGLTGGIGSGKSTVAARLAMRGATVIDADQISRSLTATGGKALGLIAERFGPELISADGSLERQRMRELVFTRPEARQQLEAIIHPLIAGETMRQLEQAISQGCRLIVHDIPLLVESGHWRTQLDGVLVVDCPEEIQIERVIARSGLSRQEIEAIIQAQASRNQRLACADWVVFNGQSLDLDALNTCVDQISAWFGL
ncbi:dephospho-CoA kinase [Comamonas composti]|uniref:dephospho-CoA kinase n=1 Tax=Comamonas composti TaxID=408558 RepID=UPI0004077C9A|nr:dephospho-CoA kinase [Comamonas composti]